MNSRNGALLASIAIGALLNGCATTTPPSPRMTEAASEQGALFASFRQPPSSAKPWAWWHWMNGNVVATEAESDLDWLAQAGIGGVFQFEGGLGAPKQVDVLQSYMSPGWKEVLRRSVSRAHRNGMKFGITTSPGWSATGGPWVRPADAMKKLVWSEIEAEPGSRLIRLRKPPGQYGPYQDVVGTGTKSGESFYADVAVIAFPAVDQLRRPIGVAGLHRTSIEKLSDGHFGAGVLLKGSAAGLAHLTFDLGAAQDVRAVRLGLPSPHGFGAPPAPGAALEASDDGKAWRLVTTLPASTAPVRTNSFPVERARYFRLALSPDTKPGFSDQLTYAPGVKPMPFPKPDGTYNVTELTLWGNPLVRSAEEKAGFATAIDYNALEDSANVVGIDPSTVIDLTGKMHPDGTLDWSPPDRRRWTIFRFGMSLTGHQNGPAPVEATGLEVDKLSASRVEAYLKHYLGLYEEALQGAEKIDAILSDSIEAGMQNWTDDMPSQFARRRGYDLARWLPALTGRVVDNSDRTDGFLSDFRATISDLISEAHYGTIARVAKEHGLAYTAEALEDHRPQLGDDLAMRSHADVPAGAMWWFKGGSRPKPTYEADIKGASSVAHVLGKPVTAVEALTTFGQPWAIAPHDMRPAADLAFVLGGNRLMLHSSVHQAAGAAAFPGITMLPMLGHNFNRNEGWAAMAQGWTRYLTRTQFLLRQGRADTPIAFFIGEEAPVTGLYGEGLPAAPAGLDYDFIDATLLNALSVVDGRLHNTSGNSYAMLYLGGSSRRMSLAMLEKLAALAEQGVTIAGPRPVQSSKSTDDAARFDTLADTIWSRKNVIGTESIASAAETIGLQPAWRLRGSGAFDVAVQHRVIGAANLYFLVNRAARPFVGEVTLSAQGTAQWWDAVTGSREDASAQEDGSQTRVEVALGSNESRFLMMFPQPDTLPKYTTFETVAQAGSQWTVRLESRGLPDRTASLPGLQWLSDSPRYRDFSGTARYIGAITRPHLKSEDCSGARYWLNLGEIADVAQVRVGSHAAGTVWTPPYRIEVTDALHEGTNELEIDIATTWVNRLIAAGRDAPSTPAGQLYAGDTPARPSGLAGPVTLERRCPA
nr:hypothetical protein TQ38_28345 [Novosphingobium sp. P6W]